ncbi:glutathione S-transferase N-terminal domain-containing protein [Candidatus Nomurabacteria bacterium]|nr:glutathione S-transferase N-terminal domain-containing protein [Candidatus Nomurabacteria bacterium]MCB9819131.1 glutathione S-transferase N-terminal domain-containing protein [Candidatus Nomurabacteria bacterium]
MLILYYKPNCSYCQTVLRFAEEQSLTLDLRDIATVPEHAEDLIERGGKRQVPYLVDDKKEIEMYESDDIITYLKKNYVH